MSRIVEWFNAVELKTVKCESDILAKEKEGLDNKIKPLISTMTWDHYDKEYIEDTFDLVKDYYDRVMRAQENIRLILASIKQWGEVPLYARRDNMTDTLLDISNRDAAIAFRLRQCLLTKRLIEKVVLDENFRLFFNIAFSCPCSSGSDDESNDGENETYQKSSVSHQKHQTVSMSEVGQLRQTFATSIVISGEQALLYRPYQEFIDDLVGVAIMDAIRVRWAVLKKKKMKQ